METSANPYILSMGPPEAATRRLNLAQAFNPIGSMCGMLVASKLVLPNLEISRFRAEQIAAHPEWANELPSTVDAAIAKAVEAFAAAQPDAYLALKAHDLRVVMIPCAAIAVIVLLVLTVFALSCMPDTGREDEKIEVVPLLRHLFRNVHYVGGVIAQTFYVGAQITCWTFIITA